MAHIQLQKGLPGIRGPLVFSPRTSKPIGDLVETLLRGPNSLTQAEREMIAMYVSSQNDCHYCQHCHGAIAAEYLGGLPADYQLIDQVKQNYEQTPLTDKMKALLAVAGKVQQDGKLVKTEDVERARQHGATDIEIHDTVLIAAAFCMFNRYVDGLATWQPRDPELYREIGKETSRLGYIARDYSKPIKLSE